MREIRSSGSEGGGAVHAALPTPIKFRFLLNRVLEIRVVVPDDNV
jgi:hypothetical protein